jgi:type I restriction enzyme S subunit
VKSVPLKHLCNAISRGSAPTYTEDAEPDAWVIGQSCLRPDGSVDLSRARGHAGDVPQKGRVSGNEVVVNSTGTGTLGRVAVLPDLDGRAYFVDTHVTVIRPDPARLDGRFLGYVLGLPAFREYAEQALSVGATKQRELNVDALRAHRVPLPTPETQRAIADFLDTEIDRMHRLEDVAQEVTRRLEEVALAYFAERTGHLGSTRVGYHFEVQLGKMLDERKNTTGELVPYLRNQNVSWDRFDLSDVKLMRLSLDELERYEVRPGDLLACEGRHVGKSAIWEGAASPIYYQKALHRIRPRRDASARFLMWCLWLGNSRGDYYADSTGSTIPHLPAEKLRALRIPDAPPDEQRRIVSEVDRVAANARRARSHLDVLRERLREYGGAVISEAVTGLLDVKTITEHEMAVQV